MNIETVDSPDKLTKWEMQARLIFTVIVAGKNAKFASNVIHKMFKGNELPFTTVRKLIKQGKLESTLRECRSGNYNKLSKCIPKLIELDPYTCTVDELESIHGVGPKTSRFYLMWVGRDKNSEYAALDTHVLKFLNALGYNAPKSTPTGKKYRTFELIFIGEAKKRNMTSAELDWEVWEAYSTKDNNKIKQLMTYEKV